MLLPETLLALKLFKIKNVLKLKCGTTVREGRGHQVLWSINVVVMYLVHDKGIMALGPARVDPGPKRRDGALTAAAPQGQGGRRRKIDWNSSCLLY